MKYTVKWARPDGSLMECRGLDARTGMARLFKAVQNAGPITVHEIIPEHGK